MSELKDKVDEVAQREFRDPEIELDVCAYLIRVSAEMASTVNPEWFSDTVYRSFVEVIRESRACMTKASVMQALKQKGVVKRSDADMYRDAVEEVFEHDLDGLNHKSARIMLQQLLDLHESRKIIESMADTIVGSKSFNLSEVKRQLRELSVPVRIDDEANEGGFVDSFDIRVEEIRKRRESEAETVGIPTGIRAFDHRTGGVMPGEFAVIAGEPGIGKTAAILDFAVNAWKNEFNAVVVTGEMGNLPLQFRVDANVANIDGLKFRTGEIDDDEMRQWQNAIELIAAERESFLYTAAFSRNFTVDDIERVLTKVEDKYGKPVHFLGIDYLNIMSPRKESKSSSRDWEAQSGVVWDVKEITQERNLSTWSANQVKDEAFSKQSYDLSHLKYARAISETAPIVIALIQREKDRAMNRIRLQTLKMREATKHDSEIALSPMLKYMRIHQEVVKSRNLADILPTIIDEPPEQPKKRRRKTT